MGLLDTVLGAAKLASNVFGGGSGSKSSTSSNSTTTQKQTSTGKTSASRQEFSDGFLQQLELATAESLASSNRNQNTINDQINKVKTGGTVNLSFDPTTYVDRIVSSARDAIQRNTTQTVNQIAGNTGGSGSGNSQAALLESRIASEGASTLAGVEGQAIGQAQEIQRANEALRIEALGSQSNQIGSLSSTVDASLTSLLNALKGGETAQSVDTQETVDSTGTTTGSSSTRTPFNWTAGLGNLFKDIGQS